MTESNRPPRDDGIDGMLERDPRVQYIARMPSSPSRPEDPPTDPDLDGGATVPVESTMPAAAQSTAATAYVRRADRETPVTRRADRRSGGNGFVAPLAIILVSLAALAVVFLMTQGGDEQRTAQPTPPAVTSPPVAPTPTSTPATTEPSSGTSPSSSSSSSSTATSTSPTSAPLPAGVKVCGSGVGAGGTTSCPFASNVATAVRAARPASGAFQVSAYSPTTKKDYTLSCTAGPVTVCSGGRAAVVYVTG